MQVSVLQLGILVTFFCSLETNKSNILNIYIFNDNFLKIA